MLLRAAWPLALPLDRVGDWVIALEFDMAVSIGGRLIESYAEKRTKKDFKPVYTLRELLTSPEERQTARPAAAAAPAPGGPSPVIHFTQEQWQARLDEVAARQGGSA